MVHRAVESRAEPSGRRSVFANSALPAGTVIVPGWHENFYQEMPGWRRFTPAEIEALPADKRALVIQYGLDEDFGSIWGPEEESAVTSLDNFINHSCDPNLGYDTEGNVIAARAIEAGEELTIDYGCFVVNFDEEWECACGAPSCRKRVRRTDWRQLALKHGLAMPRFLHSRITAA